MSLLNSVLGAMNAGGGGQGGGAMAQLLPVVMQLVQQNGGLDGLLQKFQQGGLGDVVQSWVSTGANLPVSADQLGRAIGPEMLQKAGGSAEMLGPLAELLPQLVDGLTPDGKLPAGLGAGGGADLGAMLGGLLGGAGGAGAGGPNLGGLLGGLLGKR